MSRARLFVLIDAFENDMRSVVQKYVLDHLTEPDALGNDYEPAALLRANDAGDEVVPIVHYLHLRQCYDVLNRHREALPGTLAEQVRSNTRNLNELVPIRNRIMHGRPLRSDDPENTISALTNFSGRHWNQTAETLSRLAADPAWEPAFETLEHPNEKVLHNLPPADYDETGLIGRSKDVQRLVEMLKRRREPMVTLTGEGGIGKTALALDVAYQIVDDDESPFECVLWVSLKREVLTAYGVRQITTALRNITDAAESLGRVLDRSFSGSVRELSDILSEITTLVVLDNLESAQGDEVIRLYDALPANVSYLFTSRIGIGEIERRYPLTPLLPADAVKLFRKFADRRHQTQLARLKEDPAHEIVVKHLRSSPLAIRWYVLSVEAGREPRSTLMDQTELLNFCVRNVYEGLSNEARTVLQILNSIDHSVTFSELTVISDQEIDALRSGIQELSRGSLVVHGADPSGGFSSRISISSTARMFLPPEIDDAHSATEIMRREQEYLRDGERRRIEESDRSLNPNVVRVRGAEDEPSAHLLRMALSHSRKGDLVKAHALVERARSVNPDFWECDRVDAFLYSTQKQREKAATLYRSALSRSESHEARGVVCHFFAGHLARNMQDLELALPFAQQAHELLPNAETAMAFGNLLVWNGKFAEGQELLEVAADDSVGRTQLIAITGVVESWRRWSDALSHDRRSLDALEKAFAGFNVGSDAIDKGSYDLRLATATIESATVAVRAASQPGLQTSSSEDKVRRVLQSTAKGVKLYSSCPSWSTFRTALARWCELAKPTAEVTVLTEYLLGENNAAEKRVSAEVRLPSDNDGQLIGEIISWAGRYGFIKHPDHPENVFFHRGSFVDSTAIEGRSMHGSTVHFTLEDGGDKGVAACRVRFVGN